MITLIFYGKLGRKFGRERRLEARSLGEALHAIETMDGGLYDLIAELEATVQGYHVQADGKSVRTDLLTFPCGEVYQITPILKGADTKGILEIVAGVALIAIGIAAPYIGIPTLATIAATHIDAITISRLTITIGLSIALGGVARMMMSTPHAPGTSTTDNKASYVFTGPVNTVQQGECVPVAYGDVICGSAVVSAAITTVDVQP